MYQGKSWFIEEELSNGKSVIRLPREYLQKSHGGVRNEGYGEKAGLQDRVQIDSVAASREELGNPMYPPAQRELEKHNIPYAHRRARQITHEDLKSYDRIYYMDSRNARYLRQLFPGETCFCPFLERDVADPYYSGDFTQTWEDICEGCSRILEELK